MSKLNLKPGTIFSETSFYTVSSVKNNEVVMTDDLGNEVTLSNKYVKDILNSADDFEREEECTKTQLAEILLNNPRVAMTVAYITQSKEKGKREFAAEKQAAIEKVQNASLKDAAIILADLIENPISKFIPGKERVMKGRHDGNQDDLGRVIFIDMEAERGVKEYDGRIRLIDTRTIQYIIVRKVKYVLKK